MVQTLPLPAKLQKDVMRIIPLGGIGEIGRNMTVFEINGKILIVDCGVLFPEENQPGVDVILPDFGYLRDRLNDIVGLVPGLSFENFRPDRNAAAGGALPKVAGTTR